METLDKTTGWADRPGNRQLIRYLLYVLCALLASADFLVHRHIDTPLEEPAAFYAGYGFAALVTIVLLAKGLRRLVGRREDYFDRAEDDAA